MEKSIQDAVHGIIKLNEPMLKIVDTPQFQRLRRIRQLGFANLVYPGANHTRFEHSLGVMHITKLLQKRLELDDEVVIAALIHDVGHTPFSHSSESLLERYAGIRHEDLKKIVHGELKDVLNDLGYNLRKLSDIVSGKKQSIVCGDIDADRMDYLVRDAYYTGVAYGVFDIYRLIDKVKFNGEVIIEAGGLKAAESLLISRFLMYPTVYFHHVCRIARKMYEKAMKRIIENGFDAKSLLLMDDCEAMNVIKAREREFYDMIINRKLFKRAIYVGRREVDLREISRINEDRAERDIAEEVGIDERYVIVDIPPIEEMREVKVKVDVGDDIVSLEDASSVVRTIKVANIENWRMGVYTKPEYKNKVEEVASDYFGIRKIRQKSLDEIIF